MTVLNVTQAGAELFVDVSGKDKQTMISLSDTTFSVLGGRIEFAKDDRGAVTHLIFHAVEGPMKATRTTNAASNKQ